MAIKTPFHPNITTGEFKNFGIHKIKRQTKSVIVSVLKDFFDHTKRIHGLEINDKSLTDNEIGKDNKIYIERDFPFTERKFPLIVPVVTLLQERKPYIGFDNFLFNEEKESATGLRTAYEVHAGMADISTSLIIASESTDLRDMLSEMVFQCFTNFYRGNYLYEDDEGGMFSIVPATDKVVSGNDKEVSGEDNTIIIYIATIDITFFIEYHFRAIHMGKSSQIDNFEVDGDVISNS